MRSFLISKVMGGYLGNFGGTILAKFTTKLTDVIFASHACIFQAELEFPTAGPPKITLMIVRMS